jgi:hypothetical protein
MTFSIGLLRKKGMGAELLFMEKTVELSFPSRSNKNIFGAEQSIPGIVDQTIPGTFAKKEVK